jgi:6-phosphogluconolactonase
LNSLVKILPTQHALAEEFALELVSQIMVSASKGEKFNIAISGGKSPGLLFSLLAAKYKISVDWSFVHFFWVDERCVPPDDPESNYGMTFRLLFSKSAIPDSNIHRIRGEEDAEEEAERYSQEILNNICIKNDLPVFDHIILGIGDDGHTASIFRENDELLMSEKICEVAVHPVNGQRRVTLTGKVINNAKNITFLVSGKSKATVVRDILTNQPAAELYPAAKIRPDHGNIGWFIDKDAGSLLQSTKR